MNRSRSQTLLRLRGPVLLVLAAVTIVVTVVSLFGSSESPSVNMSRARPQEAPTEDASGTPGLEELTDAADVAVSSYEVFLARDPFEPVIPTPVEGGGDGATAPPTTSPTIAPTTGPDGDADPGTGGTDGDGGTGDGDGTNGGGGDECVTDRTVQCDGHTVSLVDIFTEDEQRVAAVRVDDIVYEVARGERFASNFVVRSIEASCATIQFGDDLFTLCEGESVLK